MQAQHGDAWPRTIYKPLTWICDLDHPGTNETETLRFTTDTDLARHIRKSHKEIDSDEMQIMTRHNSVLLNRPADVCPFCCYTIEYNAKTKNAATDESEVQKTHPDVTVPDALKNLYDIPEESGDRSSKSCPPRRIDFHIAGHLNTFTMLMIRMISIPDNGDNIENGESAVFSESNSVGDDESDYQKWESSDDEDVSAKMPETSSNIQYYQPSVHENSHLSETSPERDNDVGSSVISVHDLGFSVAPPPTQIANDSLIQNITSVKMLRENLGLEPKIGTSVKESLREKIKLSLAHSQSNHGTKDGRFLPIDELNLILSGESIKALLEEEHSHKIEKDLNSKLKVYLSRRRILGTLLFMYPTHLRLFEGFVNEQITDEDLPLVSIGSTDEFSFRSRLGKENKTMFRAWEDHDIVLFYHYQPIFLAPFFDIQETRLCNYSLDEFIRLPWLKYELTTRGSNGMVYRVEIHPSHHNFKCYQPSNSPLYFALKEIPALDIETYQQELLALEKTRVQTQKERHLIKPLLTFQHGSKYYFLFEWADGNLWDYWTKYPDGSKHGIVNSLWMAEQCLGLATAVRRIHGLATWQKERRDRLEVLNEEEKGWGRHGDIKPHNILWFSSYRSDGCFLALSDLALTRYNSSVTRSRVSPTSLDGCTELYRPPELDIPGQHISSKYDIWSLGCVFLEFCTWWLRGLKSVQDFESQRATSDGSNEIFDEPKYFTISRTKGGAEPKVKGIVQEWIEGLRADAKDDLFLEPMLDLIRNKMLVVGRKNRYPADRVCTEIWNIVDGLRKAKTSRSIAENLTAEGYWGPQSSSSSSTDAEVPRSFFDDDLPDFETRTLN
ncbi:kinase-like domain-containing protein [Xylaria flabelliformis]|nr:kinase-like domain-containing protein [Xylaria flabelliformis]